LQEFITNNISKAKYTQINHRCFEDLKLNSNDLLRHEKTNIQKKSQSYVAEELQGTKELY
jgi:hypothetical protein